MDKKWLGHHNSVNQLLRALNYIKNAQYHDVQYMDEQQKLETTS